MGLNRAWRNASGSVRFSATGGHALRMLPLCARDGIVLRDVRATDLGFEASVSIPGYRRLAPHARKTGTRLHILSKQGWQIWLFRNRKRYGLFAGLLAAAGVLWVLSRFIWVIRIDGTLENTTPQELREQLRQFGLYEGASASALVADHIERDMMIHNDDLAFIAVNIHGSSAEVIVRQRTRTPPKEHDSSTPANVVSLYDGIVRSIEVYTGREQVQVGDTVRAGDLLISAIVETQNGRSAVRHATGRVMIEHEADLSVAVPLTEEVPVPTGESRTVRFLEVCGREFPVLPYRLGDREYEVEERETRLSAFGTPLPVVLRTREYRFLTQGRLVRTERDAALLAEERLDALEAEQLAGAEILQRTLTGVVDGNSFLLTAHYLVVEDAALEKDFSIN
ncbi:MAG: sporulation protein YqfD [Clostridiales bacterium]|nr:sporulation protein YqfD [Clostridiales bacterium]